MMEEWGLPGLQARFEFVAAGETVELKLDLRFDPTKSELTQTSRGVWLGLCDRLSGATGNNARPAAVNLVTSLASNPLTVTADGAGLREQFVDFVSNFAASSTKADAPLAALTFSLPKAGAATLSGDIFELGVRLEIGPVPIVIASPRPDETMFEFASAFEEAWQGFDGADGRVALAVEDRPEGAAFWCVRTGAKSGIVLSAPAQLEVAHFAVPPLSTALLSGAIEGDSGTDRFAAIDLDSWWDSFAAGFERMESAAGSGEIADRFGRVRAALAAGLASRLLPIAKADLGGGLAEVRTVYEAVAEADLRSRPVVASATVEVGRGAGLSKEPDSVLHGLARTPAGTASAVAASPSAVHMSQGRQRLAYAVPSHSADEVRRPSPMRFEADRIERKDAPPLRLLPRAPGKTDALGLDFERQYPPIPMIAAPAPPRLSISLGTRGDSATIGEALAWTVEVEARTDFSRQDRIELALGFEEEAGTAPESTAFHGTLFEALGRAVVAAGAMPDEPEPASVERFAALAEAVAQVLAVWPPPVADVRLLPGKWRYTVDFHDLPTLIVSREGQGSGQLPPWPAVSGFVTPVSEERKARFEPETVADTPTGLRFSFTGLRLLADRFVQVHGRTIRNANIADFVEPAFVYHGAIESSQPLSPRLEWQAPRAEPPAADLEAAIGALLSAIDGDCGRPYGLGLEAGLVRRLDSAGEVPLEIRVPLVLMPRRAAGGAGVADAELAREIAQALGTARAGIEPEDGSEQIALTIDLFNEAPEDGLLARLEFRIPVAGKGRWWGPTRSVEGPN